MLVELAKTPTYSEEWTASFEKGATKENPVSKKSGSGELRERPMSPLSDACS